MAASGLSPVAGHAAHLIQASCPQCRCGKHLAFFQVKNLAAVALSYAKNKFCDLGSSVRDQRNLTIP